jgi:23S rRNA (adenine2503-C2)-methyltransferase
VTPGDHQYILDLEFPDLEGRLAAMGQPSYRARQVWHWMYHRLAGGFGDMTDLPRQLRDELSSALAFSGLQPIVHQVGDDGLTRKVLFRLADGNTVETVLMLYDATDTSRLRRTVCASTQAGCALGCTFCATGQGGLKRNLTTGEIVGQVLHFARELSHAAPEGDGEPAAPSSRPAVTNVIFAGMGEPLANYDNTVIAIRRLNDADGFGLGARHMSISTSGLVPGIRRLAEENLQVNLAISLHAPNDELRSRIMPINRRYPLSELLPACRDYVQTTGRRIAFEYILIDGLNSLPVHAKQLAALVQGMICMVNLIPMNPVAGSAFSAPRRDAVIAFQSILSAAGVTATIRIEKGREIQAACGQLRAQAGQQTPEAMPV